MKINRITHFSLVTALALALSSFEAPGQGSLTPPGAPAAIMKTLQQIEPRRDVQTLSGDSGSSFVISAPGAYYLTTNIVGVNARNGIRIATNNVMLDLNGFALIGTNGSSAGIEIGTFANLSIYNGTIRGWGGAGVHAANATSTGCRFERLLCSGNGAGGLAIGASSTISDCTALFNTGNGILGLTHCTITGCTTASNTFSGVDVGADSVVANCTALGNGRQGIYPDDNCVVRDCLAAYNGGNGILTDGFSACAITGCIASHNTTNGITLGSACNANNNTCNDNLAIGILANGTFNRIEANHCMNNGTYGIQVLNGQLNVVIRNSAGSQGIFPGLDLPAGNSFGPIIIMNSGQLPTTSTGWENFEYHLSL